MSIDRIETPPCRCRVRASPRWTAKPRNPRSSELARRRRTSLLGAQDERFAGFRRRSMRRCPLTRGGEMLMVRPVLLGGALALTLAASVATLVATHDSSAGAKPIAHALASVRCAYVPVDGVQLVKPEVRSLPTGFQPVLAVRCADGRNHRQQLQAATTGVGQLLQAMTTLPPAADGPFCTYQYTPPVRILFVDAQGVAVTVEAPADGCGHVPAYTGNTINSTLWHPVGARSTS